MDCRAAEAYHAVLAVQASCAKARTRESALARGLDRCAAA
jgi:hypothetical protein